MKNLYQEAYIRKHMYFHTRLFILGDLNYFSETIFNLIIYLEIIC